MWLANRVFGVAVPPLALVDQMMNAVMPAWLALAVWGVACGALSTTIYWLTAPQRRLMKIRSEARSIRAALRKSLADDTEFGAALALALKSIRLSLSELALVGGPAIAASVPGLLLIAYLSSAPRYLSSCGTPVWPWLRGWEGGFFLSALLAALALRKASTVH